ncbi:hypothetical protein [Thauera sp. WH-1]|uniref:hypothetical protein n=1 Tax=Thauera sp. WH-1 TaxID=3398230 RepID=UPI0039FC5CC2
MTQMTRRYVLVADLVSTEGNAEFMKDTELSDLALLAETALLKSCKDAQGVTVTAYEHLTHALIGEQFNRPGQAPELDGHLTFPDWRIVDGSESSLPGGLDQPGTVELSRCGYGACMTAVSPTGDVTMLGIEFDAGVLKMYLYGPDAEGPDGTTEEPLCSLASTREGVIVHSQYAPFARMYTTGGGEQDEAPYDGDAVIAALRKPTDPNQEGTKAASADVLLEPGFYVGAAQSHGESSDPDHEVGDLQDFLRAAFKIMTPEQRKAFALDETVQQTLEGAFGDLDQFEEMLARLRE